MSSGPSRAAHLRLEGQVRALLARVEQLEARVAQLEGEFEVVSEVGQIDR